MANIEIVDEKTIKIKAGIEDALTMIREATAHQDDYKDEIITIVEKMPGFEYVYFCFYAYDSARLFEKMLGIDPREYTSFSMDAPDAFFYTLYGGLSALYAQIQERIAA